MSISTAVAGIALLSSVAHGGTYDVTAGPAKTGAMPGATVTQKVANHGTLAETVNVGIGEIGRANGICGISHSAPLASPSISSIHLNPGQSQVLTVKVAPTGPAGYHAVTVEYTVAGSGHVRVAQGVATVIGVTYPGSPAADASSPCVAISETPAHHSPVKPIAAAAGIAGLSALGIAGLRRSRKSRKAA